MPEWMEPYRSLLVDYGLGIEDLMNDQETNSFNNAYRAFLIAEMRIQIGLLTRLYKTGLLKENV